MEKFLEIIEKLAVGDNGTVISLQKKTLHALTPASIQALRTELTGRLDEMSHDVRLAREVPFLEFFLGHGYCLQKSSREAIQHIRQAVEKFQFLGQEYNTALGHWYLGLLYAEAGHPDSCNAELKEAFKFLAQIEREASLHGKYSIQNYLHSLLGKLKAELENVNQITFHRDDLRSASQTNLQPRRPVLAEVPLQVNAGATLAEFWVPLYHSTVSAHLSKVEWIELPQEEWVDVNHLMIQGQTYGLVSTLWGEQEIHFSPHKKYGLIKVDGKSMNAFRVPIEDGDYVLFYRSPEIESNVNKVVILSRPAGQGRIYLVKQLKRRRTPPNQFVEFELVSHTTESGPEYDSALLEPADEILGEVIAVAKPMTDPVTTSRKPVSPVDTLVFSDSEQWRITPEFLFSTLTPYLAALGEFQNVLNQAQKKPEQEIYISLIKQASPISVSLDGASQTVQVVRDMVVPWRRKHAEELAFYEIEEKKASVLKIRLETAKTREETRQLKLENDRRQWELDQAKVELALKILATINPHLSDQEKIPLLVKLLPSLGELILSKLEINSLN
jgi:hypothetical protein